MNTPEAKSEPVPSANETPHKMTRLEITATAIAFAVMTAVGASLLHECANIKNPQNPPALHSPRLL